MINITYDRDIRGRYGFSFFEWTQILAGHYGLTPPPSPHH